MDGEIERLRRRARGLEAEVAALRARAPSAMPGARTSRAGVDLLFIAAEMTRAPMTVSDPNLPDNPIVFANRAFLDLSGYDADEVIGRNCRFLQGPGTDPADVAKVRDAVVARREVVVELLNYRRDGTPFRNELHVGPVFDPDGRLAYFFAGQLDVTRFRTDEGLLADSEARYRALFEAVDAGFCVVEVRRDAAGDAVDFRVVEANPAFEALTGATGLAGRWGGEAVPGLTASWLPALAAVARTGHAARFESDAVSGRWFDVRAMRVGAPARQRVALLLNDVTERRASEQSSREDARDRTTERDMVWRTSRDLFVISGRDGRYRAVNPAWTEALGWTGDELVGAAFDAFVHPEDVEGVRERFGHVLAGGSVEGLDVRILARDGSHRWFSWTVIPQGDVFYAAGRDVTERKALEEQLRQSQKLEAVGQLTGGVAHDFNNLLTVIKSSTDLLKRPGLAEERRARYVGAISDTVDRAAKLTGQLLAFARRQALKPETFDVGRAVTAVADMVGTLTGARIAVEARVEPYRDSRGEARPILIDADPSQFDTALVNMVVNARDAMDGAGRLSIRVGRAQAIPAVRAHAAVPGDFVAVSVSDNGCGIAPEDLDRIFEPFFTTKGVGQGTGLGLSQVFGFAKQSGGEVVADSAPGAGATFTLYLPRSAARAEADPVAEEPPPLAQGHGTRVLLVEDNAEVGAFAEQALRELGYDTVWARDAEGALAELARASRFEVVFSDVVMPGMNGIELAREIRRRRPGLPVVLASGYSHVLAQEGTHGFDLLRKPYSVADLSRHLRLAVMARPA